MELKRILIFSLLVVVASLTYFCSTEKPHTEGLIGIYYSEPDLTSIKGISVLTTLNQKWDDSVDYEGGTSGDWYGYIVAPATGDIDFHIETNKQLKLNINNDSIKTEENSEQILTIKMEKGKSYPINILFLNPGKHEEVGWFNIEWSWTGHTKSEILFSNLYYTEKESSKYDFLDNVKKKELDSSNVLFANGKNVIVYYQPGRFAAWPANRAIWNWGNEILVGFNLAYYKKNKYHHSIDRHSPSYSAFARSFDGGMNWALSDTTSLSNLGKKRKTNKRKINYATSGFALLNTNNYFYYSYNKGNKWNGPFSYPNFGVGELTARTDYLVEGTDECLIFLSAKDEKVRASLQDRAMCIKTANGGLNFEFVSWMTELDTVRSVMPATVRINENHLVSAMRRRLDPPKNNKFALPKNWIDVYESFDNGKSWKFLNKIADTDNGIRNGNPPSMVITKSGILCVVYGYRGKPYGIRAKISKDNGKNWSKEIILRDDAHSWDIGYLRSVVNKEDNVVSVYYYSTKERPEQHIEATIWNPNTIEELK